MKKLILKYEYPIAIIALFMAMGIILLSGCASKRFVVHQGKCKQNAIYAALTFEDKGYDTRIIWGKSKIGKGGHVQAQVWIDGEWRWLEKTRYGEVITGHQHWWFTPDFKRTHTIKDVLKWCGYNF